MTIPAAQASTSQRSWVFVGVGLVVISALTYLLRELSLNNVAGVTRRGPGNCCDTEFVNSDWWLAMSVIAIPVWWVARYSPLAAILAVAIPTVVSFGIATTTINRYEVSGWGDGLEVLSYLLSVLHLLIFLAAAGVGAWSWRRQRNRQRQTAVPV